MKMEIVWIWIKKWRILATNQIYYNALIERISGKFNRYKLLLKEEDNNVDFS